jgi:citrate/tricarballylate utilization protein
MPGLDVFEEAGRQLVICNACRYCEGYCPVFRAIETRRDFQQGDIFYLANLCHDCRACYYACMYTPPHEFAINIPEILAKSRMETYRRWSWPAILGSAFTNRGVTAILAASAVAVVALLALFFLPPGNLFTAHLGPGAFYEVVPYAAMVTGALILFFYGIAVWLRGGARFWSETANALRSPGGWKTLVAAVGAALGLRYLKGGGPGCFYPDERPSGVRRFYHALTFWGFLSDLVSTTLAFFYQDIFHWIPPYGVTSAPVIFGSLGGVLLIVGTGGLIYFKLRSDREPAAAGSYGMDYVFLVTLGLTALTGMLTLIFRATPAMGSVLVVHLACIAALFVTAPYGKFVHAVYRTLAIVRYEVEAAQPRHGSGSH